MNRKGIFKNMAILIMASIVGLTVMSSIAMAATAPVEEWNKTYEGNSINAVQQTIDGGYVLAGNARLIKVDADGNKLWNKTFGGTKSNYINSVQCTSDSGYILAGSTSSYNDSYGDAWLIKTDANGNEQWNKTFGGTGDSESTYWAQQTTDSGYIFVGTKLLYGAISNYDVWLVKTDANGNELWNKTFGGASSDGAYSVQQTVDDGYILAGLTKSYGAGNEDIWLIKTDANGNEQWNKTFGGIYYEGAKSVRQTSDGDYILAGYAYSFETGNGYDAWLIKTDSAGNKQWDRMFGGTKTEIAYSVWQTLDGGYVFTSSTNSYGAGGKDAWLIKTDASGNKLWEKTFGGMKSDQANSVQQTSDGGYILAGSTSSYSTFSTMWLVKVSSDTPPPNHPPTLPTNLTQLKSDGTEITIGDTTNERTVVFKANISDLDGDNVSLQVELRRLDEYGGEFNESKGGLKESDLVLSTFSV